MNSEKYFENLKEKIDEVYSVCENAKSNSLDISNFVEVPIAKSMAEKVVKLVSTVYSQVDNCGVKERIFELEKEFGKLHPIIIFKIAEEIASENFCKFDNLIEAIDCGIRIAFSYLTLGVVSSPIEGYTGIEVGKREDGKDYLIANFSGPIRSAGTTASCLVLILIDYLREKFGFYRYDISEDEVNRMIVELNDFNDKVANLQYMPRDEEIVFLIKNLGFQISGDPSEEIEVSNFKNLKRVNTNRLRSGVCLVFAEGLSQKATKGFRLLNQAKEKGLVYSGFDFLKEYIELHEKNVVGKGEDNAVYMKDLMCGRPLFGLPSKSGGFRFRYGRGRTSGFSAVSIHPGIMGVLDDFLAIGSQLKIEKPSKGCTVTSCDSIEGPIVRFKNGNVKKINSYEEGKSLYNEIEEIIYLGDILFPFSDVLNRNSNLIKSGYVEEWWNLELKEKGENVENYFNVDLEKAIEISRKYNISLYPKYIYFWNQISVEDLKVLVEDLKREKLGLEVKRILELLGVEHEVNEGKVIISEKDRRILLLNLGSLENFDFSGENVLDIVNKNSEFEIRDKAGSFIGSRMGRPEKTKLRKLPGSPNCLFSLGREGGRLKSFQEAISNKKVFESFVNYKCESCGLESVYNFCEKCGKKCILEKDERGRNFSFRKIDIVDLFEKSLKNLGIENIDQVVKGVFSLGSRDREMERIEKGILRSMYNLSVNKDGTIRVDSTELPIVSFKAKEIGVNVEKLKELGYVKDVKGNDLVNENQILELMPHDVILPDYKLDESLSEILIRICNFIDELLVKFYKVKPYYNVRKKEDLVGKLGVCMAPHNCAGVVCRFIGFSNTLGLFASPFMHAAVRRDCFDYNTFMPIKENGFWKISKIGDVVEKLKPERVVDNFGTKEINVKNFKAVGDKNGVGEVGVNNFTKHEKSEMFKVKTSLGKELVVTENHKFLVDGKIKNMNNLKVGDKLPLPYNIKIEPKDLKKINLLDFLKNEKIMVRGINEVLKDVGFDSILKDLGISKKQFVNYKRRDSYPSEFVLSLDNKLQKKIFEIGRLSIKRDNVEVPIIINIENDLLEVVGLYIAEGFSRENKNKKGFNQVDIASKDKGLRSFVKKVIFKHFNLKASLENENRVLFSSRILYLFFTKVLNCGSVARDKRIPSLFLNLPLERLACVLRGYYEGDGSVSLSDRRVSCDSISEGLLFDLEFCLGRFGIFVKRYNYKKKPGLKVREFYLKKKREIPEFEITKLIIGSDFVSKFFDIGFLSKRKNSILEFHRSKAGLGMRINYDEKYVYDPVISIESVGKKVSYCLNVDSKNHLVMANSIISKQCDGDEVSLMLLTDVLLNFSRKYLPKTRGSTQDAPLVLNSKIDAGEVDDQILDFEYVEEYPLELYRLAESGEHSSKVKVRTTNEVLKEGNDCFSEIGFTHDTNDFNFGSKCSSYKTLEDMKKKLEHQLELCKKIRSSDVDEVVRLVVETHFLKDIRGNFEKFFVQNFRCVKCNKIHRRPPLIGKCDKCGGKIIFTINEGGIRKYLGLSVDLVEKYRVSDYLKNYVYFLKKDIDRIFI